MKNCVTKKTFLRSNFHYHGNDMINIMRICTTNHSHYYQLILLTKQAVKDIGVYHVFFMKRKDSTIKEKQKIKIHFFFLLKRDLIYSLSNVYFLENTTTCDVFCQVLHCECTNSPIKIIFGVCM